MPTLSSILFTNNNNTPNMINTAKQHDHHSHFPTSCCSCTCHNNNETTPTSPTTTIFTPTKWFPRIRRRSSSASSITFSSISSSSSPSPFSSSLQPNFEEPYTTSSHNSSRRQSLEYMNEIEDKKQIKEFEELYKLAVDEMAYAIESQDSIYYSGDLITATEAVDTCLDRFRHLMQTLNTDRSHTFQQEWTDILFELRSKLDSLPFPSDDHDDY